jgi:AP-1 complex subunit beta-1
MDVPAVPPDSIRLWERKLAPPLVTLLSADAGPEAQYVALRCAALVVQRRPQVLAADVRVFFCRYDDPGYVKAEKLAALVSLASEKTAEQVLLELKEYASEVDVDFARRSVRSVGKVALAVEAAAERSVEVLLDLLRGAGGAGGGGGGDGSDPASRSSSSCNAPAYVVQEVAVALRDVLRRYPGRFEAAVAPLFEEGALEAAVDEPEAKAAVVWILGEHSERLEGGDALLEQLLESFPEEDSAVQMQLLSATVKVFLRKPTERAQRMIQLVLSAATGADGGGDDPDLRDRAYVYWRLLSTDPEAAKRVALASKPAIADDCAREMLDKPLLDQLVRELGCLSSVFHRPADSFVSRQRLAVQRAADLQGVTREFVDVGVGGGGVAAAAAAAPAAAAAAADVGDLLGGDDEEVAVGGVGSGAGAAAVAAPAAAAAAAPLDDLFGGGGASTPPPASPLAAPAQKQAGGGLDDLLGSFSPPRPAVSATVGVAGAAAAGGAAAATTAAALPDDFGGGPMTMAPTSPSSAAAAKPAVPAPLDEDAFADLGGGGGGLGGSGLNNNSSSGGGTTAPPPFLSSLLSPDGAATVSGNDYLTEWRALDKEVSRRLERAAVRSVDAAKAQLAAQRLAVLAHRPVPAVPGQEALYVAGKLASGGALLLLELRFKPGEPGVDAVFKSSRQDLAGAAFDTVGAALAA